ncbi:Response regulator receiver domain-containing protein [Desulfonatronum thiosulfatophilum]|uniref:Response regulator receiver domain-containing protein n=1 Tax=Desulfonatronum thiosulfatophilum TaxID=617002 RepID=A0A1G6A1F3_9BACT|nr:response regulator [Desulfonatronum thiosulfatophilum]SDB02252.1 Response regulator receiver domain-containing protein [Desulfonatronum thiosulfatophilum]
MQANILVIDDEESIRFSFQRFLSAVGHHVITAEKYLEALSEMDAMEFDLILADIILEDGCGMDILREVVKRNLKTQVIIMTAYPTTETEDASHRMQAVNYLTKPLRQKGLLYSIDLALQASQTRQVRTKDKPFPFSVSCSRNGCSAKSQYLESNH